MGNFAYRQVLKELNINGLGPTAHAEPKGAGLAKNPTAHTGPSHGGGLAKSLTARATPVRSPTSTPYKLRMLCSLLMKKL